MQSLRQEVAAVNRSLQKERNRRKLYQLKLEEVTARVIKIMDYLDGDARFVFTTIDGVKGLHRVQFLKLPLSEAFTMIEPDLNGEEKTDG